MEQFRTRFGVKIAAAVGLVTLASCGGEPAIERPDVEAVRHEYEGQSDAYAFAYGVGLLVGCNRDQLMDENNQLRLSPDAQQAYETAQERNPEETARGFEAGLERGLLENKNPHSEVC